MDWWGHRRRCNVRGEKTAKDEAMLQLENAESSEHAGRTDETLIAEEKDNVNKPPKKRHRSDKIVQELNIQFFFVRWPAHMRTTTAIFEGCLKDMQESFKKDFREL
ncbi:unnamed protein product [Arabis nemorensis]|uniref:Uncharacterized protein n=1 Tax=Arabis nemorensis TaxID=586526 RepID=A0A565BW46_9BRAS|nr:unnamed protein product [Arabis nemorensis]